MSQHPYFIGLSFTNLTRAFPVAQMVKNLSAMQETQVRSLCQKDPLGKGMNDNPL